MANENIDTEIVVCGDLVENTKSEKLLGLVINDELTWKQYLYGENWRVKKEDNFIGLIPKLAKRVGLLKRLKKFMNKETFSMVMNGIFSSTLIYCLPVFANIWLPGDEESRFRSFRNCLLYTSDAADE